MVGALRGRARLKGCARRCPACRNIETTQTGLRRSYQSLAWHLSHMAIMHPNGVKSPLIKTDGFLQVRGCGMTTGKSVDPLHDGNGRETTTAL